ncbi:hypothetical protein ACVGW2_05130, partial [Enterobacter intestinihominis]
PFELSADDQTNWAHYHIASEPLAPGGGGAVVPRILSNNIKKMVENNKQNNYKTLHGLNAHQKPCSLLLKYNNTTKNPWNLRIARFLV